MSVRSPLSRWRPLLFVLFVVVVVVSAWSNAVNFTDGLDGLAAGSMGMVTRRLRADHLLAVPQCLRHRPGLGCYNVRDPLDLALIAAATAGACIGFLWWNAAPAKIFMGDTGSLALGGIIAGISVTSRTEVLAVVLGALFVAEIVSVVVQILAFRTTGRRVFRMAPFHHHFELRRVGRNHGDHPVLAAHRDRVWPRGGAVLRRVARVPSVPDDARPVYRWPPAPGSWSSVPGSPVARCWPP